MASRTFRDRQGVEWIVWKTIPSTSRGLGPDFGRGWLTFQSEGARRRLAPVPPDWETVSDDRLQLYCRAATETRSPVGRPTDTAGPGADDRG